MLKAAFFVKGGSNPNDHLWKDKMIKKQFHTDFKKKGSLDTCIISQNDAAYEVA